MNLRLASRRAFALASACYLALASELPAQLTADLDPGYVSQQRSVSVTLGFHASRFWPAPPNPEPVHLIPGAQLHLKTGYDENTLTSIAWFKNNLPLPATSTTLTLSSVAESDSGYYRAEFTGTDGKLSTYGIHVRVGTATGKPLLALSSRGTISSSSPVLIGGLVIGGAPNESKSVLIRAVGPSLSSLGVPHPLPAPRMKVFDQSGKERVFGMTTFEHTITVPPHPPIETIAARVGAFPLIPGARDHVMVLTLVSGLYTVHVMSSDGGSGDVLLEIYDVPDGAMSLSVPLPPTAPPEVPVAP